jgi:hypothetical protein
MGSLKKYVFGRSKGVILNTFIGGVASTINTASLLAAKIQISTSRITSFSVVGNDIQCKIDGSYNIPANCFRETGNNIVYYDDRSGLVSILNSECFSGSFGTNTLQSVNFPNANSINQAFSYATLLKKIDFPNCTSVLGLVFAFSNIEIAYFPKCNILGNTSGNDNVFSDATKLKIIYVNPFLQTNNNGQPDGDLSFAISQGIIVRYVTNFTVPNTITNLSAGAIYNTAIQLNFTAPISANAIDYYELYINGIYNKNITSGQYLKELTANTSYTITVIAVDVFYNKSVVSNSLVVSTANNAYNEVNFSNYIVAADLRNTSDIESSYSLIKGLEDNLLWNKIQALYLFKGNTAPQHRFNAKNPLDTNAAFRLLFSGTGTHNALGYTGNGTNAFANTNFIPSANQNVNSNGLTIVVGTNNTTVSNDVFEIGVYSNDSQASGLAVKADNTNFRRISIFNKNPGRISISGTNEARGIFTGTRINTVQKLIRNANVLASAIGEGTLSSIPIYIGGLNINNNVYGASNQRIQIALIHEGLSDAEVTTLHSIIDISETIAGRKTW